jgi:hypothetical protein
MPLSEEDSQAFIVRVWREPREMRGAVPDWRGMIEHVPSKERRYIKDLGEIAAFITPYLQRMGVKLGVPGWLRQWLCQRR